jgi:O-antigen/teichoic acid export membrane protein
MQAEGSGTFRAYLVRGASGSFGLKMLSTGLVFLTTLVLSRFLGSTGYGNYAFALAWISLLIYPAMLGLNVLLTREVARYKTDSDWSSLQGLLAWSHTMVLLISLGLALLAAGLVWLLRSHMDQQTATTLWIAMAVLPFMALIRLREGAIRGLGAVVVAQLPQLLIRPALFLTLVVMVHFAVELSAPITVGIRALATAMAFLAGTVLLKKYLPGSTKAAFPNYHPRRWLRSAFPLFAAGAAGMINDQISIIMVGSIMGAEGAGIFDVARRGAMFISLVLIAVNMPLGPTVARLYALGQKERLQRAVTKSVRLALLGSLPVALGLIVCGHWYLLLFGREFTGGNIALAILSVGQLVNVGIGSVALLLNMTGYERYTAIGVVVALIMNGMLNVGLIPIWGVEGAAIAHAVSLTFLKTLLAILVYKKLKIHSTAWA